MITSHITFICYINTYIYIYIYIYWFSFKLYIYIYIYIFSLKENQIDLIYILNTWLVNKQTNQQKQTNKRVCFFVKCFHQNVKNITNKRYLKKQTNSNKMWFDLLLFSKILLWLEICHRNNIYIFFFYMQQALFVFIGQFLQISKVIFNLNIFQ